MKSARLAPGLYYDAEPAPAAPSPLRSDIAGFVGRTRRGPVGQAVRVTGWRECKLVFGGLADDANTPFSLQGYFDNGGDVAHVVRLLGPARPGVSEFGLARASWDLSRPDPKLQPWSDWRRWRACLLHCGDQGSAGRPFDRHRARVHPLKFRGLDICPGKAKGEGKGVGSH